MSTTRSYTVRSYATQTLDRLKELDRQTTDAYYSFCQPSSMASSTTHWATTRSVN